ncbi:sigma-54-dependent Fis family transcriptional regulator [candidate division KSB1 bacterium]|nr:sigma-54-dependent Fis family transcriptional regulator [candidate division KSB1 bacterium]RQW05291.1 MAG: sigma-54-dependent Fis family transcriptional regulator [candidate division KSB1 bacterium]
MRILVIDDDANIRSSFKWLLEQEGHQLTLCENGEQACDVTQAERFDMAFCDVMMPGMGGLAALECMISRQPELKIIMISGQADIATAVKATKLGAFDFMEKPLNPDKVLLEAKKLEKQLAVEAQVDKLQNMVDLDYQMIGDSPKLRDLIEMIKRAAPSESRILIYGENGTGKELIAREIHKQSGRTGQFVQLNCAALPRELVESELFGYEKGAFTGANRRKIGLIEEAEGGTLLLDEVSDMAPETQAKLLRVLQENEFTRVGSTKSFKFRVRILSATNKDLLKEISAGRFREDLYFRLNVIPIHVPPLRERKQDILSLVHHFLGVYAVKNGKRAKKIAPAALQLLLSYHWPGNIRELRNTIERLSIMIRGDEIGESDVQSVLGFTATPDHSFDATSNEDQMPLKDLLHYFESQVLQKAFAKYDGNVSRMALALQTDRANLHKKLRKFGIK